MEAKETARKSDVSTGETECANARDLQGKVKESEEVVLAALSSSRKG